MKFCLQYGMICIDRGVLEFNKVEFDMVNDSELKHLFTDVSDNAFLSVIINGMLGHVTNSFGC